MSKILIAVPCLEMVYVDFMTSMLELQKPEGTTYNIIRNSLIYDARNAIALNAINAGYDKIFWVDSDIRFPPDILIKFNNYIDSGMDYITSLCFTRTKPYYPCIFTDVVWQLQENSQVVAGADRYYDYPKDSLFEVAGSGFGCVMTSVAMIKDVIENYGSAFTPLLGMGEDLAFCWKAKQLGHKMYCDSSIKCGHIGIKTYDEETYLESRKEEREEQDINENDKGTQTK